MQKGFLYGKELLMPDEERIELIHSYIDLLLRIELDWEVPLLIALWIWRIIWFLDFYFIYFIQYKITKIPTCIYQNQFIFSIRAWCCHKNVKNRETQFWVDTAVWIVLWNSISGTSATTFGLDAPYICGWIMIFRYRAQWQVNSCKWSYACKGVYVIGLPWGFFVLYRNWKNRLRFVLFLLGMFENI